MDCTLPGMIVTGASGFVGRNFLKTVTGRYRLFCIARRSQSEAGVRSDDNLRWTQVDIAEWEKLKDLIQRVQDHGGVDYIVHFAGYYDFTNKMHLEYTRTNVEGTRNVLALAKQLGIKRFLFASSLAACEFSNSDRVIDESSPPDADFPYALSKRAGEAMMREYSQWFPCTIIRMAAIFGDWCEYPPLYVLMNTWLSGSVHSRILGGHGQTAVPYIHIYDLIRFCLRIIEKNDTLPEWH
jgi:nucleoside-diphosphate-sugar epimerase